VPIPAFIAHADWSTDRKKRQVAVAELTSEGHYCVVSLGPAQPPVVMNGDLRVGLNVGRHGNGQLLAGFDLPFGLPRTYAERAGITFFPDHLAPDGHGPWDRFADVAHVPDDVRLHRPFYPSNGLSVPPLREHIYDGLGMTQKQLRRRADGSDAEMMFWTLYSKQVGKAALAGWQYLSDCRDCFPSAITRSVVG
jgi:hypothetical protein